MLSRGSAASSYCTTSSSSSSSSSAQSGVNMSLLNELEMSAGSVGGKTPLHLSLRRYGHRIRGQKNMTNGKKTPLKYLVGKEGGKAAKTLSRIGRRIESIAIMTDFRFMCSEKKRVFSSLLHGNFKLCEKNRRLKINDTSHPTDRPRVSPRKYPPSPPPYPTPFPL